MGGTSQVVGNTGTSPLVSVGGTEWRLEGRGTMKHNARRKQSRSRLQEKGGQAIWSLEKQTFSNFNGGLIKMQIKTQYYLGCRPRFYISNKLQGHPLDSKSVTTLLQEHWGSTEVGF